MTVAADGLVHSEEVAATPQTPMLTLETTSCPYRYYLLQVLACSHAAETGWTIADIAFFDHEESPIKLEATRSSVFLWGGVPKVAATDNDHMFEAVQVLDGIPETRFQFESLYTTADKSIDKGRLANGDIAGRLVIDMKRSRTVSSYQLIPPHSTDEAINKLLPKEWKLKGSNDLVAWADLSHVTDAAFPTEKAKITCGELL
eukprot:CAMPEP_0197658164 /NCGR_PEP_ID=MMETSP1338-20131121/45075_1 /TAXON_ID=43686 ORGANISM="Pelagodinium beii, Strain RCC1491" /NCGR_SAMPLE_ID=MMETSP1338 /ASSEMBLY_ACC=CAM_ASM_000754 /LENGTH=201 /DNA_ID=CAMNT_0043234701 /DNA_START=176 /DNA_END=781 /DNA_ORIENTATION=-